MSGGLPSARSAGLAGTRLLRDLRNAVINASPARTDPFDFIVRAGKTTLDAKNGAAAIRQGEGEWHHD